MNSAITIGFRHGSKEGEIVRGPTVGIHDHNRHFRELSQSATHDTWSEVQVWESHCGITRLKKFTKPQAAKPVALAAQDSEKRRTK